VASYARFKQHLIRKPGVEIGDGENSYGLGVVHVDSPRAFQPRPFQPRKGELQHRWVKGGGVPGGHHAIYVGERSPYVPSMRECNSIPLRYSDVVVDIGAYVGTFAIRAARFPVKRVVAYEPTPFSFEVMSTASALRNLELRRMAVVASDEKEVTFYVGEGYGPTNSIAPSRNKNRRQITVPAIRYADAVRGATVVKIDVEGAEHGYQIVQPGVRAYVIDFHKTRPDWLESSRRIIAELEAAGFKAVIEPGFTNGLNRAGSWVRDTVDDGSYCEPLMAGEFCCGCGAPIAFGSKALCVACWEQWTPLQRSGFGRAETKKGRVAIAGERALGSLG
jgi:FkbM family methyltransferase